MNDLERIQNVCFVGLFIVSVLGIIMSLLEGETDVILNYVTIIFLTSGYALEVNTE